MPVGKDHAFGGGPTFGREVEGGLGALLGAFAGPLARIVSRGRNHRTWRAFASGAAISPDLVLGQNAWCVNFGEPTDIRIAPNVCCRGTLRRERFGEGRIEIDEFVYIGDDVLISCAAEVRIGRGTMIAHGVQVVDNDSHPHDAGLREEHWKRILSGAESDGVAIPARPVTIGARCWLGFNAIVLKGVTIGDGAIVAAGSVVTHDVKSGVVVAGNPACVVRLLDEPSGE